MLVGWLVSIVLPLLAYRRGLFVRVRACSFEASKQASVLHVLPSSLSLSGCLHRCSVLLRHTAFNARVYSPLSVIASPFVNSWCFPRLSVCYVLRILPLLNQPSLVFQSVACFRCMHACSLIRPLSVYSRIFCSARRSCLSYLSSGVANIASNARRFCWHALVHIRTICCLGSQCVYNSSINLLLTNQSINQSDGFERRLLSADLLGSIACLVYFCGAPSPPSLGGIHALGPRFCLTDMRTSWAYRLLLHFGAFRGCHDRSVGLSVGGLILLSASVRTFAFSPCSSMSLVSPMNDQIHY
jgi:hypothetical protein